MVLCACNSDHTEVKLVSPPASSLPGDRVKFPGFNGEPVPAAQIAKKKILEKLGPQVFCVELILFELNIVKILKNAYFSASHRFEWNSSLGKLPFHHR
jgi:hypothetical protein